LGNSENNISLSGAKEKTMFKKLKDAFSVRLKLWLPLPESGGKMEKSCKNCKHNVFEQTDMPTGSILMNSIYKCDNSKSEHFNERMGVLTNLQQGTTIDSRENRHCEKYNVLDYYVQKEKV